MNYQTIKAKVFAGERPTLQEIDAAIKDQLVAVATFANSVAKHTAKLVAAGAHPFPLPEDQEGRVARRIVAFDVEHGRLLKLYVWRELVEYGVGADAPASV